MEGSTFCLCPIILEGFSWWLSVKEYFCNARDMLETRVWSLDQEDPLEEGRATTTVFLPGESHGQRSLTGLQSMGWQSIGHDWSDWTHTHTHTHTHTQCILECIFKVNLKYILQTGCNFFPLMLYSRFLLVIYLIYSSVYMPIPISQFIPPSLPITVSICLFSKSVSFLLCIWVHLYCFSRFHIYMSIYTIFLFLTSFCLNLFWYF